MADDRPEAPKPRDVHIMISPEQISGVWANFAMVKHSPYEFTIDFSRLEYDEDEGGPIPGIVVQRVSLSPLFVLQLIEALQDNWQKYSDKAMPKEVQDGFSQGDDPAVS